MEAIMDIIICGKELRIVRGKEVRYLHIQDDRFRVFTVGCPNELPDSEIGESYEFEDDLRACSKRFVPWRTNAEGMATVRGHTVTYHRFFGVQCWLHAEMRLPEGIRNVAVLVAEGKELFLSREHIAATWKAAYSEITKEWPLGLLLPIEYDRRKKKHVLAEEHVARVVAPSAFPRVDSELRGELSASPAR